MSALTVAAIGFAWTLLAFGAGAGVAWLAGRKQRRLLKHYRQQALALRKWSRPIE